MQLAVYLIIKINKTYGLNIKYGYELKMFL